MNYIPKTAMKKDCLYYIESRNLLCDLAIWNGEQFYGRRRKFGDVFFDTENHYDDGSPHGTVKPYRLIG